MHLQYNGQSAVEWEEGEWGHMPRMIPSGHFQLHICN